MRKFNPQQDWFRLLIIIATTIVIGGAIFLLNNLTGLINLFLVLIQAIFGIIFGVWYFRVFLAYLREFRKKDEDKKIGVQKGWAIYGSIDSIINVITWGLLSSLIFNVPKIIYLIPFAIAMIQVVYIFSKANRRRVRDWLLLLYNVVAFLYLLSWTLIDFGIDMPNIIGVFSHTINSEIMWWQLFFVNTGSFFTPTFLFPPYMLNPRYYLAMPVEEYYRIRDEEEKKLGPDPLRKTKDIETPDIETVESDEKKLPGERTPFFEERKKMESDRKVAEAMQLEAERNIADEDDRFAEFISLKDFALHLRKFVKRIDSFIRTISLSIILALIIITPFAFAGNVSLNVIPNYDKLSYSSKPGMVLAVQGNVFSFYSVNGSIDTTWEDDLANEIALAKELHVTHLRYDINARGLLNNNTRAKLATGLQLIKDEGINLIIEYTPNYPDSFHNLKNAFYINCSYIAQNYKPDYLIIYNEINGELQGYLSDIIEEKAILTPIANLTSRIKTLNPTTKVVTTVLALNQGQNLFENLLTNSTLDIDAVGVNFYPVLFGWRTNILYDFAQIYEDSNSSVNFWLSEIGIESFNFGEDAQAKYLAKIASLCSSIDGLNTNGLSIVSLIDNLGRSTEQGIVSHLGLVYYNGRKKKAFHAISYAYGTIQGII
ncbi:MAG: hypothetical protein FK733_03310 [Asgard group archaeon]|nr:hypothetical protein [Asgard group archaeon]